MSDAEEVGLPAREAAAQFLEAALARRAGLDEALSGSATRGLSPRDRAFARALTMATLRRLGAIDRALEPKLQRAPPERVKTLLRLGMAQLFWLDVPDHAAVSTMVALADRVQATRKFKGLINAVLRGLQRDGKPADDPEALAPAWLMARWQTAFGADGARAIAATIALEPATDLTARDPADAAALAELLEGEVLPGGSIRTARRGDLAEWPAFAEGRWWVQDAGAAIPTRLLAVRPGETALDLCAAPGGKTLQLAAAGASVVALDRSADRLKRVTENLARVQLSAEVVTADARSWPDKRTFDAVLLDAPCSATGTFRRHPDVLWAAAPGDIASLAEVQTRMLESAAGRVKPGGRLVYCVCSLEPEEGEAQVRGFLARHPEFTLAPVTPGEGGAPAASVSPEGWLRILPQHLDGGIDGFFAARMVRKT
ncbi:MAG: RsmB/NOP family class I SAM-dependent RNA methyltransferase [Caulobacter sp.]|nr:RsmB/NOP family class I SAM-dependent RNA methyltransferase [Caulobacter sp.]